MRVLLFTHGSPVFTNVQNSLMQKDQEEVAYSLVPVAMQTQDKGKPTH